MQQSGSIQIIYGPMFSGKSSELLRKVRRFEHAKKKCLVINYLFDNRYTDSDQMATHDRVTKKAFKTNKLMENLEMCEAYDVIGVDQGQFFSQIVEFCQSLANLNKIVLVSALDGTFERKPFGNIVNLIPLAEKVTKLCAVCVSCAAQASFTKRIVQSKEIQLIGGAEMYQPVCRACFFEEKQEEKKRETETQISVNSQQQINKEQLINEEMKPIQSQIIV